MAKSKNRKNQKIKAQKRTEKGAREIMHEMKREQNMLDNIEMFQNIIREFAENQKRKDQE